MRTVDIWSHVAPEYGGVGPAAAGLAVAVQKRSRGSSTMLAFCSKGETQLADGIPESVKLAYTSGIRPIADFRARSAVEDAIASGDVCHVHGLWLPHSIAARQIAFQMHRPTICSMHGMLEPWELRNKYWKKRIYSLLIEKPSLARTNCLRALGEKEVSDYRLFGLRNPVAVVPNGVPRLHKIDPGLFTNRFPALAGKPVILFLSRIHFKKGIFRLIQAWPRILREHPEAHLAIVGPDCEGTSQRVARLTADSRVANSVTFCGTLSGEIKVSALSAARFLCLPSYSEGQSVAVLEALSIGLPVIVTPACNVDGVAESGAGIVTSNEVSKLADSVTQGLSLSQSQWLQMSASAVRLARDRFDWEVVGAAMHSVYSWMLGGPRPPNVSAS